MPHLVVIFVFFLQPKRPCLARGSLLVVLSPYIYLTIGQLADYSIFVRRVSIGFHIKFTISAIDLICISLSRFLTMAKKRYGDGNERDGVLYPYSVSTRKPLKETTTTLFFGRLWSRHTPPNLPRAKDGQRAAI